MVPRSRDPKHRATLGTALSQRARTHGNMQNSQCNNVTGLGSPCNAWKFFCPNESGPNPPPCCSTLLFLLNGACDSCTFQQPLNWTSYSNQEHCDPTAPSPDPDSGTFPPNSTDEAVPNWAVQMAKQAGVPPVYSFDTVLSLLHDGGTSATPTSISDASSFSASATASLSSAVSQSIQVASSSTPASTSQPSFLPVSLSSKGNSKIGPIVGGIIGALVLLALVGVGIWYMRRRRRRHHIAPSAAYRAALRAGNPSPMPYQPVFHDSPKNSTDDLSASPPSRPISIHSESRFREHTS